MILCSIRYFGMTDFTEINRMTLSEYRIRGTAYRLKQLDSEYMIAREAWLNRQIMATKKKGKNRQEYVYKTFKSFFDYEKAEQTILDGSEDSESGFSEIGKRCIEYKRLRNGNN